MTTYQIGATYETLTNLEALSTPVPEPFQIYKPYSAVENTADGRVVGVGWPRAEWEFGYLTDAQRNQLRYFCQTASAEVYVTIYNDSLSTPAWESHRAIMEWPHEGEERRNDKRLRLTIKFKLIEDVTE